MNTFKMGMTDIATSIISTNHEIVIGHIANLNVHGLNETLSDKHDYNELPKSKFLNLLSGVFNQLKSNGSVRLDVVTSICAGCQAGARVKLFICEKTKSFLAFAIDVNDQSEVTDIFSCNKFTIKHFPNYQDYVHISFDTDNNSFFLIKPLNGLPTGE